MVSRSTLITFCATLLCSGSAAAAQSSSNRSSYLRQPRVSSDSDSRSNNSSPSSSDNDTPHSPSDESPMSLSASKLELAEFASSIAAYSAAYNKQQAIVDDRASESQPAAGNIDSMDSINNNKRSSLIDSPVLLWKEDFCSNTITNNNTIHGRNGVIQLSPKSNNSNNHPSSFTTPNLLSTPPSSNSQSSFTTLTVTFSYQTIQMTHGDKFCIDLLSTTDTDNNNNGLSSSSWHHEEECYEFGVDFENGFWYDDVGVEFELEEEDTTSLSVRWSVSGDGGGGGDLLLDWVKVVAYP